MENWETCPTSGERLIRGYTKFDLTIDEGEGWLNPSRDKNEGKLRRRKVDEKSCVTFLLCETPTGASTSLTSRINGMTTQCITHCNDINAGGRKSVCYLHALFVQVTAEHCATDKLMPLYVSNRCIYLEFFVFAYSIKSMRALKRCWSVCATCYLGYAGAVEGGLSSKSSAHLV